jgi:TetR/AcrR family transcriptional regulator
MATTPGARRPTFTEQARRQQLVDATIDQVTRKGYAGASLSAIAEAAGITKAAVLYHFATKDALVDAAYVHALTLLTDDVGAAVDAAGVPEKPAAYVRAMVGHLRVHPRHTRMLIEALSRDGSSTTPQQRWGPLASLIDDAARARGVVAVDARALAIVVSGAIDAIVVERLHDADYDTAHAADVLADVLDRATSP